MEIKPEYQERYRNKKIFDLMEMSPEETLEMAQEILNNNSTLEIYVHPFYFTNQLGQEKTVNKHLAAKAVEDRIRARLHSMQNPETKRPLVIMEESDFTDDLPNNTGELTFCLPYIKTQARRATPAENPQEKIVAKLKELGVKNISLAGIERIKKAVMGLDTYQGCVGQAADIFNKDFRVTFADDLIYDTEIPKPVFRYGDE